MPEQHQLNRILMLANSGHDFRDALTSRLPAVNTWIYQVVKGQVENIPRFTWSITPGSGDIEIFSELSPTKVELWSAISCSEKRRDWRTANLDVPCTCGTQEDDMCFNEDSEYSSEVLEETAPGNILIII